MPGPKEREEAKRKVLESIKPEPTKREEIVSKTKLNPKRVNRALEDLEKEGKVKREGAQKGYWYYDPYDWFEEEKEKIERHYEKEKKEIMNKFFYPLTPEDYDKKLNHCRLLFEGKKKFTLEDYNWISLSGDIAKELVSRDSSPYSLLLQHIENGYPEIHDIYEVCKELKDKENEKWRLFCEEVEEQAKKAGFKLSNEPSRGDGVVWNLTKVINNYLARVYTSRNVYLDIKFDGDTLWIDVWSVTYDKNISGKVKEFIENTVDSRISELWQSYHEAIKERDAKLSELRGRIEYLALWVKHGNVLEGSCDFCPKVSELNLRET